MNPRRLFLMLLLLAAAAATSTTPATAQAPTAYLDRGIEAYQALEYDAAAGWLRRALTPPLVDGLSPSNQVRGLAYLGATEQFRGRSDSAAASFRRMLRLDPRARPDPLIFPPEVTRRFEQVRAGYPIVRFDPAEERVLDPDHRTWRVGLAASTPHDLLLTLDASDGRAIDTLYAGPIGDTLAVLWNGRAGDDAPPASGRYWLTATSVPGGAKGCRVRLPLELTTWAPDTLPHPAPLGPEHFLPERAGTEEGPAAVGKAAFVGVLALALPLIAKDAEAGQTRVVAGALGVTGVIALIRYRPGRPLSENIAANAAERARWTRRNDQVTAENAERRRNRALRVSPGAAMIVGCDQP